MADDYFPTDSSSPSQPLPTPSGTPYQTPMLSVSRRSSSRASPPSSAPLTPPLQNSSEHDDSKTPRRDDRTGVDSDSFTPTLHASLVSEILSLRREIDSKNGFIERLEVNLSSTKYENENLHADLARHAKESRSAKKQLQAIEDSTLEALEELSKERDTARTAAAELKSRLETAQKKSKVQLEHSEQSRRTLEDERSAWLGEKSLLERRANVAESRLNTVLDEVAAREAALDQGQEAPDGLAQDKVRPMSLDSPTKLKRHSRNRSSVSSFNSLRRSVIVDGVPLMSLADELDADEEEAKQDDIDEPNDDILEEELPRLKKPRDSRILARRDEKARKILGMDVGVSSVATNPRIPLVVSSTMTATTADTTEQELVDTSTVARQDFAPNADLPLRLDGPDSRKTIPPAPVDEFDDVEEEIVASKDESSSETLGTDHRHISTKVNYVTSGTQYTPPASPDLRATSPEPKTLEIEANQRRKRDPISTVLQQHARARSEPNTGRTAQGQAKDTVEDTAQRSLTGAEILNRDGVTETELKPALVSASTQTEPLEVESIVAETETPDMNLESQIPAPPLREPPPVPPSRPPPPVPLIVPSIEIHPPESGAGSPAEQVTLPPGMASVGSQTDIVHQHSNAVRSVGMQTEAIRIDRRAVKLPPHLLPSAIPGLSAPEKSPDHFSDNEVTRIINTYRTSDSIPSTPTSPLPPVEEMDDENHIASSENNPHQHPPRSDSFSYVPVYDNEEQSSWARLKRTLTANRRTGRHIDAEIEEFEDAGVNGDTEVRTSASRPLKRPPRLSTKAFDPPTPVPEDEKATIGKHQRHSRNRTSAGSRNSLERARANKKPSGFHSGRHVQTGRVSLSRGSGTSSFPAPASPSTASIASSSNWSRLSGPPPPFAIPPRGSSKPAPKRRTESQPSPTRRSTGSSPKRSQESRVGKRPFMRKSRSTTAASEHSMDKPRTPTTTVSSASWIVDEKRPPLPTNIFATKKSSQDARSSSSQSWRMSTVVPTGNAYVRSSMQHTVVDAIAATMIGEWMYKYVRKRKSFGVTETQDEFGVTGDSRHKRWVWLSPYERTVMWNTKQPISNAALLGKSGRTLSIQSVLDVKDDTPPPKGVDRKGIFNRSILVLTPSRALKFTATTRERHFLWLTALSFLAHHTSRGNLDLSFLPPSIASPAVGESQPQSRSRSRSNSANCAGKTPWQYAKEKKSQHSSGYATPAIPESDAVMARPTSRSAVVHNFVENHQASMPDDAALPPAVPRVPHSRKRSQSNPIGATSSTRPSSSRSFQMANLSFLSSHSNRSNEKGATKTLSAKASRSGGSSTRNLRGLANDHQIVDEGDEDEEVNNVIRSVEARRLARDLQNATLGPEDETAEFGGNNNFFDAVGSNNLMRMDAFAGPGLQQPNGRRTFDGTREGPAASNSRPGTRPSTAREGAAAAAPVVSNVVSKRAAGRVNPMVFADAGDAAKTTRTRSRHRQADESPDSVARPGILKAVRQAYNPPPRTSSQQQQPKKLRKKNKALWGVGARASSSSRGAPAHDVEDQEGTTAFCEY